MNQLLQDVRYAFRQLRKAPGFTATAVLTLALGIGANAAIFTLVHAVLLRSLPVADPKSLVRVGNTNDCCVNGGTPNDDAYSIFAYELYLHLKDNTPEFEQLAAMQAGNGSITARSSKPDSLPKSLVGEYISGNYFDTLGLKPLQGRLVQTSDDAPGAPMVAVMSYRTWQREYALDPSVVGSSFTLNTHPVTVIGITPEGFYGDRMANAPPDFYLPMNVEPVMAPSPLLHRRHLNWVYLIGRIKPGTQLAPLQAKMSASLRNFLTTIPLYQKADQQKHLAASHVVLTPGGAGIENMQENYGTGLKILMAISALVLLIACANIANLVLVRGMARRADTSIRVALGAQRSRVIRQMLTESVVLSCLGGCAGLIVAYAGTQLLLSLAFPNSPDMPIHASPSPLVLGFAFVISLLTGLIFGLAPAWITSHAAPADALRGSNRTTKDRSSLLQRSLVVFQAALSLVLLVGAGLLSKSLSQLEHQNFGVETQNRWVIHISPDNAGYKPENLHALYEQITQKFQALPGVERVALSLYAPLEGNSWNESVAIQGRPEAGPNTPVGATWLRVGPGYFDIIGHHVLRGRGVTDQDTATSPAVAVVNQAFVKKFFPDGHDPLGMHFGTDGVKSSQNFEIVGVVSDIQYASRQTRPRAMYFRPFLQVASIGPDAGENSSLYAGTIVLQTRGSVENLEAQTRSLLASIDANLPVISITRLHEQIDAQFGADRLTARLTLIFGVLALILASVGLYGVTAYTAARRTSEIGIRMALGAARRDVIFMVLRGAMLQSAIGIAIGLPVALLCVRFVKSQLYNVQGHDIGVLVWTVLVLAASAFVAGLIPAQRAASADPMSALRTE